MSEQIPIVCKPSQKKRNTEKKEERESTKKTNINLPSQNYFADAQLQYNAQTIVQTPRLTANL